MDFESLVEALRNPGEDGVPDTIYDDLTAAHTGALGDRDGQIAQLQAQIQDRDTQISRLKSMGFDSLLSAQQSTDAGPGESPEDDNDADAEDGSDIDVEDLFEDKD